MAYFWKHTFIPVSDFMCSFMFFLSVKKFLPFNTQESSQTERSYDASSPPPTSSSSSLLKTTKTKRRQYQSSKLISSSVRTKVPAKTVDKSSRNGKSHKQQASAEGRDINEKLHLHNQNTRYNSASLAWAPPIAVVRRTTAVRAITPPRRYLQKYPTPPRQ